MNTLLVLAGVYLIWFAMRVTVFNYVSEAEVNAGSSKDKQIYWGGIPVLVIGVVLLAAGAAL